MKFVEKLLINIPMITGRVTTMNIFKEMLIIDISFDIYEICNMSADLNTINGTEIILIKLIIAVSDIERATSPLANFVSMLDVTPPGAAAIIITPSAISIGVLKTKINIYAIIGNRINWQISPIIKSLGFLITLVKSFVVKPRPRPSIINAKAIGAIFVTISIYISAILLLN